MPALVTPLFAPITYARWLHMLIAAGFAAACTAITPGLEGPALRTAALLLVVPVPVLLVAGLLPRVRDVERAQARLLLFRGDAAVLPGGDRSWSARGRTVAWLLLRLEVGVVVAYFTVAMLESTVVLLSAPFGATDVVLYGLSLPADRSPLWLVLAPLVAVVTVWSVALAGRLLAAGALWLLGPSPSERVVAAEARAERLLEQNLVARELHDAIGHALATVVLQAMAAREVHERDSAFVGEALGAIERTGRGAMEDLERVLTLLRGDPSAAPPGPTLAELDTLVRNARITGARVDATVNGPVGVLSTVISREAYRIVQEGLTNALRHGGAVPVSVRVEVGADRLDLCVDSPLRRPGSPPAVARQADGVGPDSGGLRGMRERVVLLGGELLTAGPVGQRWRVHIRLPHVPRDEVAATTH
ncbi:sensor histidine kinase [Plantactinospora sp. ZYX-F-223]|uniref:sensor histidine kinase n=1 Tax=Plantactinospora sp. ZYX-F-223 TaxID=3144103 RepID=UPI0031FC9891